MKYSISSLCILKTVAFLFLASPAAGTEEEAAVPSRAGEPRALPASVQVLLEAQGRLEAGRFIFGALSPQYRTDLLGEADKAGKYIERIYPACRAILSDNLEQRVCASLYDAFSGNLAAMICPARPGTELTLSPVYPADVRYPGGEKAPEYGTLALIVDDPGAWQSPGYWGASLEPPVFAGWSFEPDTISLSKDSSALVRSDFKIDDAEVTGEVRIDEGESIFIILRSDIVVKFHAGEVQGSGGNLSVKFGYDNLRSSSAYAKVPAIVPGHWYSFRIVLSARKLRIVFEGEDALETAIVRDPRTSRQEPAQAGYFGFGCNKCSGAFRNVHVKALSTVGKHLLPRFRSSASYIPDGDPIKMLDGKADDFISLVHNRTEAYKESRHPVTDGVLFLKGAPYVQLARKNTEADHFRVQGKIRFRDEGSVWFRVNSTLVFGLRCMRAESPFVGKHTTGNFNYVDEENAGASLKPDEWYTWGLEYHEPIATLHFNGKRVAISLARTDRDREKTGPNQFGISSYNTEAELSDVVIQKLVEGGPGGEPESRQALQLFKKGFEQIAAVSKELKASPAPESRAALDILEGTVPPVTASAKDIAELAAGFRVRRDWPTYLALLEAGYLRFPDESELRRESQALWESAKKEYDAALKSVGPGEIGLDNILRVGDKPASIFSAADGQHVWISVRETKELLKYDCTAGDITAKLTLPIEPALIVGRKDYYLCTGAEGANPGPDSKDRDSEKTEKIYKIRLADGTILAETEVSGGTILDLTGHPKKARTFLCVNHNTKPMSIEFGMYKIHVLDEETMEVEETDATGMFATTDPLGRYLYAGFHARWSRGVTVDTAFLRARPVRGHIDHLVRYRLTSAGPVYDDQRAAPGIGGFAIAVDPRGRTVCYVSEHGFVSLDGREYKPFGIGALKATDLITGTGTYEAGSRPEFLEFNPVYPEAYLLAGNQVRRYYSRTFELQGGISLPPPAAGFPVTQLLPMPDGSGLMIAYSGKPAGVYIQRLSQKPETGSTPAGTGSVVDPSTVTKEAQKLIAAGRSPEARQLLEEAIGDLSFTDSGEQAASLLLELDDSPYVLSPSPFQLPEGKIEDTSDMPSLPTLILPKPADPASSDSNDPSHGESVEFIERLDMLLSLRPLAEDYPHSWLWQCHRSENDFPGSPLLKLEAALALERMNKPGAASNLAREILDITKGTGSHSFRAYSLLARIYAENGDRAGEVAALSLATSLRPRDAAVNARLGAAYAAVGCPNLATYHKLVSWYLFPSSPALAKDLVEAGAIPGLSSSRLDTSSLFREARPAVVLVSHDGGNGTGFILGRNGLLLTNYHVVEGGDELSVKFKDPDGNERSLPALVLAFDSLRDVALLRVDPGDLKLTPLILADSDAVMTGDRIVAIGNPSFGSQILTHTATEGIISGKDRILGGCAFFQISAAVNPGNSGGPLLNEYGHVVGMVTLKAQLENVGFAVPSGDLLTFIEKQEVR